MIFSIRLLNISALYLATEKENNEIIKLLLVNDKINVNVINIFNYILKLYSIIYFYHILN